MTVRLDQLELAFAEVLASVGVHEIQELITEEQCCAFVNLAMTGLAKSEFEDKAAKEQFEKAFKSLADPDTARVSRRKLIEHMILRMRDKGLTIVEQ